MGSAESSAAAADGRGGAAVGGGGGAGTRKGSVYNLGVSYARGQGIDVNVNYKKAVERYEKAGWQRSRETRRPRPSLVWAACTTL